MRFSEADDSGGYLIEGYGTDWILIAGRQYRRGLILTPSDIIEPWGPASAADIGAEHLDDLLRPNPRIILLGTGARQVFPDPSIYLGVQGRGIGIEIMSTAAACRTYNILMSEGRAVVAGLLIEAPSASRLQTHQ